MDIDSFRIFYNPDYSQMYFLDISYSILPQTNYSSWYTIDS